MNLLGDSDSSEDDEVEFSIVKEGRPSCSAALSGDDTDPETKASNSPPKRPGPQAKGPGPKAKKPGPKAKASPLLKSPIRKSAPRKSPVVRSPRKSPSKANASKTTVPCWRKAVEPQAAAQPPDVTGTDVFNMDVYGEEEWGPDNQQAKKKKRGRKKKDTKAILLFGHNDKGAVAPIVKKAHNLKTPKEAKAKSKPR